MAEGAGTRYSQLAESLASVKQNQDRYQQNHNALQQMVQGLAQKLDLITSHVEALVQMKAAQNTGDLGGSSQQITNPLFEDHGGIQTRTVRLVFPDLMEIILMTGFIELINFLVIIKPIHTIGSY